MTDTARRKLAAWISDKDMAAALRRVFGEHVQFNGAPESCAPTFMRVFRELWAVTEKQSGG